VVNVVLRRSAQQSGKAETRLRLLGKAAFRNSLKRLQQASQRRGGQAADGAPIHRLNQFLLSMAAVYPRSMKAHTEYLTFRTQQHRQYVNITAEVRAALDKSGIQEGMILVSAMHITAGVWVNDAEDGLLEDIDAWLEKLAPFRKDYRHHHTGETNGDSHLKSLLVHHQVIVPVTAGKLDLGPWQEVYYAEFDGQRSKRLIIKVMGE
jgi:secondary thiamine-phosphate synthase enzyme